jgi:hypothetical protein
VNEFDKVHCQVRQPNITQISVNQTVSPGESVDLFCSTVDAKDYSLIWSQLDNVDHKRGYDKIISAGASLVVRDSRYRIRHHELNSTYVLHIQDVQEDEDAGDYACQIILSASQRVRSTTHLSVKERETSTQIAETEESATSPTTQENIEEGHSRGLSWIENTFWMLDMLRLI